MEDKTVILYKKWQSGIAWNLLVSKPEEPAEKYKFWGPTMDT